MSFPAVPLFKIQNQLAYACELRNCSCITLLSGLVKSLSPFFGGLLVGKDSCETNVRWITVFLSGHPGKSLCVCLGKRDMHLCMLFVCEDAGLHSPVKYSLNG